MLSIPISCYFSLFPAIFYTFFATVALKPIAFAKAVEPYFHHERYFLLRWCSFFLVIHDNSPYGSGRSFMTKAAPTPLRKYRNVIYSTIRLLFLIAADSIALSWRDFSENKENPVDAGASSRANFREARKNAHWR